MSKKVVKKTHPNSANYPWVYIRIPQNIKKINKQAPRVDR
jgi:hypothetical protein